MKRKTRTYTTGFGRGITVLPVLLLAVLLLSTPAAADPIYEWTPESLATVELQSSWWDDLLTPEFLANPQFTHIDSLEYEERNGLIYITGCSDDLDRMAVPPTIQDKIVAGIDAGAFAGKTNLQFILIPNTILTIGSNAFAGCDNVHTLSVPFLGGQRGSGEGLSYFFSGSSLLQVFVTDDTAIGSNAFANCAGLKKIALQGNKLETIGNKAFYKCTGLVDLELPEGLTSLGSYACAECISLTTLTLPEGLKTVDRYAFQNCTGLEEVTIPKSVTGMGEAAFQGCINLTALTMPFIGSQRGNNEEGRSSVFGYAFGEAGDDETTVRICQYWNGSNGTWVRIPKSLRTVNITDETVIPHGAFYDCDMLTTITLSDTVTKFGNYAFYNCSGLTGLVIPPGVTDIPYQCFYNCKSFPEDYTVPDTVKTIGSYAYRGCTSFKTLMVPESVTTIEEAAFANCNNLTAITLPFIGRYRGNNEEGGASVFGYIFGDSYWDKESSIRILQHWNRGNGYWTQIPKNLTTVTITDETVIPYGAFENCDMLTNLTYPASVTGLGGQAFYNCTGLSNLPVPAAVKTIPYQCFYGCTKLPADYVIPDTVEKIESYAYQNCTSFKTLTVPKSVTTIEESAFANCNNLTAITLPFIGRYRGNNEEGGESVFGYIFGEAYWDKESSIRILQHWNRSNGYWTQIPKNLTTVTITDETVIPYGAFENCDMLTNLTYPTTVTKFGGQAFYNCSGLSDLPIPVAVKTIPYQCFYGCTKLPADYVIPDTVEKIESYAYQNCTNFKTLTVPDSVQVIESQAFVNCTDLTEITLPFIGRNRGNNEEGRESVFSWIFGDSNWDDSVRVLQHWNSSNSVWGRIPANLAKVTITDETVIPYGAFEECIPLEVLIFPDTLKSVKDYALKACSGINSLTFTGDVPEIAATAFTGVTADGYYPTENPTWTDDRLLNYGGTINWHKPVLLGDVNGDSTVDEKDLTALAHHVAKIELITDATLLKNADVTGDGQVTAADLTKLARYVAKIISTL